LKLEKEEERDGGRSLEKLLTPRKKMKSRRCSSSALISGVLRRCSGEVERLQWWWSSSMTLVEREWSLSE